MKEKRAVVKSILHGAQGRFGVAAAEVADQAKWQRATLGFVTVSGRAAHAEEVLQKVERFVYSFPEVDVLEAYWGVDA
ncbi:MAG: DUF503 domain-containing protein [Actinomycetota bacterium]|nr:DUF503 domain-containing protein [Actinomycetota bacterium]MDQ3680019.1 DUF503 domain-containing protein [Actinomycetota bacterium]